MHVFYDPATKEPYGVKKPVTGAIVAKAVNSSTHAENLQKINDMLSQGDSISGFPSESVMVIAKASDINDAEVVLEDAPIEMNLNDRFKETKNGSYYHYAELLLLTKDDVNWYASTNAKDKNTPRSYGYDDKIAALVKIDKDKLLTDNWLYLKHSVKQTVNNTSWRYGSSVVKETVLDDVVVKFDPDDYKAKSVWLKHGDFKARLVGMPYGPANIADRY